MIYFTAFHILVLHLAALLRFLVAYMHEDAKEKKEGRKFSSKEYFSDRWDNWTVHYVAMWILMLVLPNIMEVGGELWPWLKTVKDNEALTMLGTVIIGFLGYDFFKLVLDKFKNKIGDTSENT